MKFLLTWFICLVGLVVGTFGMILAITTNPIAFLIVIALATSFILAYYILGGIE